MKEYEKGFDLILGKNSKEIFILLYKTPFKKDKNLSFKIDKISKKLFLFYNKESLIYEKLDDSIIDIIRKNDVITVLEVDEKNGYTNGNIIDTYEMRAK